MSDQTTTVEQTAAVVDPFDESSWKENLPEATPPAKAEVPVEKTETVATTETVVEEKKEPVVESTAPDYLKELGFTSLEEAKTTIENLKSSATTKEEIKFANDQSKRLFESIKEGKTDEVYSILDTQRKLSTVDKLKPSEAIKLHLELTNQHFKAADVEDVFEERYAFPKEPQQEIDEEDGDFQARVSDYNKSVEKINRKIERDSFQAKQELAKLQSELVLPDIEKPNTVDVNAEAADAERTAQLAAARDQYVQSIDRDYGQFTGFEVKYKDEEVEIPIAFNVTDQEKTALRDEIKDFQLEEFIAGRWFNQGKATTKQIMEDIYLLRNKEAIFQKIANEAGAKRLAEHLKAGSNITIGDQTQQTMRTDNNKPETEKMADFFFSN
jgi:hypothetical protein